MDIKDVPKGTKIVSETGMCGNFKEYGTVVESGDFDGPYLILKMWDGSEEVVSELVKSGIGFHVATESDLKAIEAGLIPSSELSEDEEEDFWFKAFSDSHEGEDPDLYYESLREYALWAD